MTTTPPLNPDGVGATKPFLAHLADLRTTLLRMAAAFVVAFAAAVPLAPRVFRLLLRPLEQALGSSEPWLRSIEVAGAFTLALRIMAGTALIFSAPFLVAFAAGFVYPGLTRRERRVATAALVAAGALFAVGVALGYFITLPLAIRVMWSVHDWLGVRAEWVVTSYVAFALQLLLAFGLVFELPIVIMALGRLGVVTSAGLRKYRRHAIVVLLTLAALLTPPDVFTQLVMAVPLIALYEACIWTLALGERRRAP